MEENISFKERVKNTIISSAKIFKAYYIDYEYLICSEAFSQNDYYIVKSYEDNYLHLTGVNTSLDPQTFYEKCINGTLSETDFDFIKNNQTPKQAKGSVRGKMQVLPNMANMFNSETMVEENFKSNKIKCSFAVGNMMCTVGFTLSVKHKPVKPMTLLKGNELSEGKSKQLDLVLRRERGSLYFNEIISGNYNMLNKYLPAISDFAEDKLIDKCKLSACEN